MSGKQTVWTTKPETLDQVREMVQSCLQCGTCTASCPNEAGMDHPPRHLWRMVIMGLEEEIFQSGSFAQCSACYYCTLRCPRELPLTEAMFILKRMALRRKLTSQKKSIFFYRNFLDNVRRYGRVHELEFMARYFLSLKDPWLPLRFTSMGLKLMAKGKLTLARPPENLSGSLESIFRQVEELEGRP